MGFSVNYSIYLLPKINILNGLNFETSTGKDLNQNDSKLERHAI